MMSNKGMVRILGLYTILTKGNKLWRSNKTKKKIFLLLGVVRVETVNTWGKPMKDKHYFSKDCCAESLLCSLLGNEYLL